MADSGNTVSVQTEDDDVNPCMKMASSVLVSWSFSLCIPSASACILATVSFVDTANQNAVVFDGDIRMHAGVVDGSE